MAVVLILRNRRRVRRGARRAHMPPSCRRTSSRAAFAAFRGSGTSSRSATSRRSSSSGAPIPGEAEASCWGDRLVGARRHPRLLAVALLSRRIAGRHHGLDRVKREQLPLLESRLNSFVPVTLKVARFVVAAS
jgi:4'-phosphopantetheinyl transferase EntD